MITKFYKNGKIKIIIMIIIITFVICGIIFYNFCYNLDLSLYPDNIKENSSFVDKVKLLKMSNNNVEDTLNRINSVIAMLAVIATVFAVFGVCISVLNISAYKEISSMSFEEKK